MISISVITQKPQINQKIHCNDNIPIKIQFRSYARLSSRRTQTEDKTDTTTTGLTEQQRRNARGNDQEIEEEETTENALTSDVRRHLSKVYGTIMATVGFSTAGVLAAFAVPVISMPAFILSIAAVIGFAFTSPEKRIFRQNLLMVIGALMGAGIAPIVAASAPGVVFSALLGTTAIFGGFSLMALKAKRRAMLALGGPLLGGLFVILACSLGSIFLPMLGVTSPAFLAALYNINIYGGLALFSIFVGYDTQNMIEQYKNGNDDHVGPALSMFMNLINIFIRLLEIFGRR